MNNPLVRIASLSLAALLLVWAGAAWFIEHKTLKAERELRERRTLVGRYETLQNRYSEKAQKAARKKFETMLRLYGVTPQIRKVRSTRLYIFTLDKKSADKVLNRILKSDLALSRFGVKRIDDTRLQVQVGVAI